MEKTSSAFLDRACLAQATACFVATSEQFSQVMRDVETALHISDSPTVTHLECLLNNARSDRPDFYVVKKLINYWTEQVIYDQDRGIIQLPHIAGLQTLSERRMCANQLQIQFAAHLRTSASANSRKRSCLPVARNANVP